MDLHNATEVAYKNGYEKGFAEGMKKATALFEKAKDDAEVFSKETNSLCGQCHDLASEDRCSEAACKQCNVKRRGA
jgi:flagellar biosynthesis/type III secretory pathway protein FliH